MLCMAARRRRERTSRRHRKGLGVLTLLTLVVVSLSLRGVYGVASAPCPPTPPPPPPASCNAPPGAPCLPNTGGGGCAIDPTSCGDPGGGYMPEPDMRWRGSGPILVSGAQVFSIPIAANDTIPFRGVAAAAPGDPSGCGAPPPASSPPGGGGGGGNPSPPPPTPVPLIPVDVPREAPGVAASVERPQLRIRMNPAIGMVNVPTWFWAEGYRGQDLTASRAWGQPYVPTTISVRYVVKRYIWNFGDGGQIESRSLGQSYPIESDIKNAYRWSSRTEPGGAFHPTLTIEWNVEYRVNGGPPQSLPAVQQRYEAIYQVQQLQPVITNP